MTTLNQQLDAADLKKSFDDLTKKAGLESLAAELGYRTSSYTDTVLDTLLSVDTKIEALKAKVRKLAPANIPVLILGETGTGKELIAKALHGDKPAEKFIDLNCGAIPSELLESELFGVMKGAYTGAETRPGLLEQAHKGTLFLDEIGDMPKMLQCKLLRVLETKKFRRIGGTYLQPVTFRLVSATNHMDLASKEGFRLDLYHRLAGSVLRLPKLRERDPRDLDVIALKFSATADIAAKVLLHIENLDLAGNVRELLNIIEEFNTLEI